MDIKDISEQIEKVSPSYTKAFNITRDADWFILKLQEELGELVQSYLMMIGQARAKEKSKEVLAEDFRKEVADVFCHVLLLAKHHDIDLEKEIAAKWFVWNEV